MASPSSPVAQTQALIPVGLALIPLPYIQKILLSLLSKHIQNLTIFPPHCYHAGPSHHHPLFRLPLNLLTGPCFSPCPLSVCSPHDSRMALHPSPNKKGRPPCGSKMVLPPPYISDCIPSTPSYYQSLYPTPNTYSSPECVLCLA